MSGPSIEMNSTEIDPVILRPSRRVLGERYRPLDRNSRSHRCVERPEHARVADDQDSRGGIAILPGASPMTLVDSVDDLVDI